METLDELNKELEKIQVEKLEIIKYQRYDDAAQLKEREQVIVEKIRFLKNQEAGE